MKQRPAMQLTTPEGVELSFPLASLKSRAVAFGIDMSISMGASVAVIILGSIVGLAGPYTGGWSVILLGLFLLRHGYFAWFETTWNGSTPGKRLLKIRVVPRDGGVLDLESVLARNILRDIELLLPVVALAAPETIVGSSPVWLTLIALGWIVLFTALPLLTRERLRAGDLVAGTLVVHVPTALLLPDEADAANTALAFSPKHLSIYGERELETLASVLRRAEQDEIARSDLEVIAITIARKVRYRGREPERRPKEFLRAFYRAQRAELERRLLLGKRKGSKLDAT